MKSDRPPRDSKGKLAPEVERIAKGVEQRFREGRRVLSFAEYLALFEADPSRKSRDASRYVRDAFDYYGTREVSYPWGKAKRYKLFDLPWEEQHPEGMGAPLRRGAPRGTVIGQEHVQEEIYRALANFGREGRPNRLVLLHGPNGSAKSTIVGSIMRALEDYSQRDDGALYCFNWVFPSNATVRGTLGFSGKGAHDVGESFAHLSDDRIDAKLLVEVRDHPLFLIPVRERYELLARMNLPEPPNDWILRGELSLKSQQIFEALLSSYNGSYADVLRHVQVVRYFISQRYRRGAVTIGPQMSVDAGERQVTADRSLTALPASLQALSLYEVKGELVDAAGGVLEFSDLLKRPLDAFKYLQLSIETGEAQLTAQNVQLNCVMMGSANELHFDAFREHPEFASFRGRLEPIRTPYLRSYVLEQEIYDALVVPQVQRHVAPHATRIAAMFAILTRMKRPDPEKFSQALGKIAGELSAVEKMLLYGNATIPERLESDAQKTLRNGIKELYEESDSYPLYEGRVGASPREMRVLLLDAAQSTDYACLSPIAVIDEIEALCKRTSEFEWLQQEKLPQGYHDVDHFLKELRTMLLELWQTEMFTVSGLVDEAQYGDLFERYVQHVSVWVKKERILNRLTGDYEEPDEKLMQEVETLLDVRSDREESRKQMISNIAAYAIEHPGTKVTPSLVFPQASARIRAAIFKTRLPAVGAIAKDIIILVREEGKGLDRAREKAAQGALDRLVSNHGYCKHCAADMASMLLTTRFADVVS
ncbi:MAG: serine protein kinase PrkA [Polyangiaceae bacterium]